MDEFSNGYKIFRKGRPMDNDKFLEAIAKAVDTYVEYRLEADKTLTGILKDISNNTDRMATAAEARDAISEKMLKAADGIMDVLKPMQTNNLPEENNELP